MTRSSALVSIASLLACALQMPAAQARDPSTAAERAHFIALVRLLEREPLGKNADATRQQLVQWANEVPDIRFKVCPDLLGSSLGADYPYSRAIETQIALSGAVLTLEHPGEARDDVAVYTAGVEGALRAYEVLVKTRSDARLAVLEDLLDQRQRGKLRDHMATLAETHCEKSIARLIAAPIGAAVGLLLALVVARGFRKAGLLPKAGVRTAVILRRIVLVCAVYYIVVGSALHFLEPEYDPRFFPMSHYAWGSYGWLMTSTFFVLGPALFAVAIGLQNADQSSQSARIGQGLLVIGALFVCLAGVFRGFPLHDIASAIALPSSAIAVLVLSWSLRKTAGWQAIGLPAFLIAVAMFAALLSVVLDVGMLGLQQRAFLLLLVLWLAMVASRPVRADAAQIRPAALGEHELLSRIALESKAHWGYQAEDLQRWAPDLTVSSESLTRLPTFVAELDTHIAGFCQLSFTTDGAELEHFWVLPGDMAKGIGRALLERAAREARARGHDRLRIDADPNAERFYVACGARRVGEKPAPAHGQPQRIRPQLVLFTRPK